MFFRCNRCNRTFFNFCVRRLTRKMLEFTIIANINTKRMNVLHVMNRETQLDLTSSINKTHQVTL